MPLPPAVIVHSRHDIDRAFGLGRPVTLLSAPGAAMFAGCLWWQTLLCQAAQRHPDVPFDGLLDCAEASGQALAALRVGVSGLVLARTAPGWARVAAITAQTGVLLLADPPPALDMAARDAMRRLHAWLDREPP